MATRPTWSGALNIFAALQAHISIIKATDAYEGREGLVNLCACHQKPFTRTDVCVEGFTRLTKEKEAEGETDGTTELVRGVPDGEDSWVVLDDDTLKAIEAAGTSDSITIAAMLDPDDVPTERTSGMYYITPNKKVKGSKKAVDLLYDALEQTGRVAVAKWAPRGREMLIVIRATQQRLIATVLLFDAEIRDATPFTLTGREVAQDEIDLAIQLLGRLPGTFDFASAVDEAVPVRQQAIAAARAGKPVPTRAATPATDAEPDLMAQLRAALDATSAPHGEPVALAAANN